MLGGTALGNSLRTQIRKLVSRVGSMGVRRRSVDRRIMAGRAITVLKALPRND